MHTTAETRYEHKIYDTRAIESTLPSINISDTDIIDTVRRLKSWKSNKERIPTRIMKQVIDLIVQPLKHIYQTSLEAGLYPTELKHARITPLHKGGEKTDKRNYR